MTKQTGANYFFSSETTCFTKMCVKESFCVNVCKREGEM